MTDREQAGGPLGRPRDVRVTAIEDIRMTAIEADEEAYDVHATMVRPFDIPEQAAAAEPLAEGAKTRRFRPRVRPPLAVLFIADDNQSSGEHVRIRQAKLTMGRDEGDVTIPHDVLMSARHAELEREYDKSGYRWWLHDLGSTNGSFVRADWGRLKNGDELLVGAHCLRFVEHAEEGVALVELSSGRERRKVALEQTEYWLGRDAAVCGPLYFRDLLLEPKHARLSLEKGRWCFQAAKSVNGVWVRIAHVALRSGCWFQLGEQRFRLFLP